MAANPLAAKGPPEELQDAAVDAPAPDGHVQLVLLYAPRGHPSTNQLRLRATAAQARTLAQALLRAAQDSED